MLIESFKRWKALYFNVDQLGRRIASKLIFVFLLALKLGIQFMPAEYSDFSQFTAWLDTMMQSDGMTDDLMMIPLTTANVIYIGLVAASVYLTLLGIFMYSGLFLRSARKHSGTNIPAGAFAGRFIVLALFLLLFSVPLLFVTVYGFFIMLLFIPFICTIPVCYLSGDFGFWRAIGSSVRRTRGFYLMIMADVTGTYVLYLIASFIVMLLSFASQTAYLIVSSAVDVWYYLIFARICTFAYIAMCKKSNARKISV